MRSGHHVVKLPSAARGRSLSPVSREGPTEGRCKIDEASVWSETPSVDPSGESTESPSGYTDGSDGEIDVVTAVANVDDVRPDPSIDSEGTSDSSDAATGDSRDADEIANITSESNEGIEGGNSVDSVSDESVDRTMRSDRVLGTSVGSSEVERDVSRVDANSENDRPESSISSKYSGGATDSVRLVYTRDADYVANITPDSNERIARGEAVNSVSDVVVDWAVSSDGALGTSPGSVDVEGDSSTNSADREDRDTDPAIDREYTRRMRNMSRLRESRDADEVPDIGSDSNERVASDEADDSITDSSIDGTSSPDITLGASSNSSEIERDVSVS